MIGLIYIAMFISTMWLAISSYRKLAWGFEKENAWGINVVIFMMWSLASSFIAFVSSFFLFAGEKIYAFSLISAAILISLFILLIIGFVLRVFDGKLLVIGYGTHFGTVFLIPYTFIFMEPLSQWLQVQIH